MRFMRYVVNVAVLALIAQPAAARVWVFGDSNVDTGWFKVSPFSGNLKFDFDLANSLTFNIGKPTDNPGPMNVEVLAGLLRSSAMPANQGGTNYATSGAKNVNVNTPLNGGFPNAVPTATQISNYISSHPTTTPLGAASDLFVVHSGSNDIDFALGPLSGFTTDQQDAYIEDQATALAGAVKSLQLNGATHIIVVSRQDSFGNAAFQRARTLYDTTLRNALNAQQVPYAWADQDQVRKDIQANPDTFHIQFFTAAPDQIACPPPDPVLNITDAWSLLCSAKSPVTQPTAFAAQTLFADETPHFSAAAQNVLGTYLFCLTRVTWPQFGMPVPHPLALAAGPISSEPNIPLGQPPFSCRSFTEFKNVPLPPGLN